MTRRRPDPYAELDQQERRRPLLAVLAAFVVVGLSVSLLAYVAASGEDDLPAGPAPNAPRQP